MPKRRSFTSENYMAARASNNLRAVCRGPGAYAKRQVGRKACSRSIGATGKLRRIFETK